MTEQIRKRKTGLWFRLCLVMLFSSFVFTGIGCGTVINFTSDTKAPMGGVVADAHFVKAGIFGHEGGAHMLAVEQVGYLFILDVPFSFAGDIVTLAYTVPYQLTRDSETQEETVGKEELREAFDESIPYNLHAFEGHVVRIYRIYGDEAGMDEDDTSYKQRRSNRRIRESIQEVALEYQLEERSLREDTLFKKENEIGIVMHKTLVTQTEIPAFDVLLINYQSDDMNRQLSEIEQSLLAVIKKKNRSTRPIRSSGAYPGG